MPLREILVIVVGLALIATAAYIYSRRPSKNSYWRLDRFKGLLGDGLVHFYGIASTHTQLGIPIARVVKSHRPWGLDMVKEKEENDQVQKKSVAIIADQGFGKTFFLFIYLYVCATALSTGSHAPPKIWFNSLKWNKNEYPEVLPFAKMLGCEMISSDVNINLLSPMFGLTLVEQVSLITNMFNFSRDTKLGKLHHRVLSHAIRSVRAMPEPSLPNLSEELERLNKLQTEKMPERIDRTEENAKLYRDAAYDLYNELSPFVGEGTLASIFGGVDDSVAYKMMQTVVSIDLKGLTDLDDGDTARSLLEMVMNAIKRSAVLRNDTRFMYSHVVADEAYKSWDNPEWFDEAYTTMKTLRERGIEMPFAFHRINDMLAVANSHKPHADKVINMLDEIEVWIVGRQSKKGVAALREIIDDMPDWIAEELRTMPLGHFWVFIPGKPPQKIYTFATEEELKAYSTEAAHKAFLERYASSPSPENYRLFLESMTPDQNEDQVEDGVDEDRSTASVRRKEIQHA